LGIKNCFLCLGIKNWCILGPFGILRLFGANDGPLEYFVVIWYTFSQFGMLQKENLATLQFS
jgi:hypothetical protein